MVDSEAIADGFEPADRPPSDINHVAEELINQLKNVDLNEVAKEQSGKMMSVMESNEGVDSKEDGDGESESEKREVLYPLRPGAEDCSFYMRNGSCKFGSSCKFNHPLSRKHQIGRDHQVREKEEDADKLKLIDCKYYLRTEGCKYGETCRFNHTNPKTFQASLPELNFLGLPIRPGEIECPYYMRTASCKYGADCKFNHPDPTTIGGGGTDTSSSSIPPKSTFQPTSTPFIPSQTPEWNGYQASSMYSSERSLFSSSSTTYMVNNSSAEISRFSQYQYQMIPAEEFPERPDQPECAYYLKTGDCKFKFICKYHHPKNRLPKQPPYALNDKGLPLRPDQNICTHYSRYGICKFGPACRFDHSVQAVVEPPQVGGNENESDNQFKRLHD